MNRSHFVLVALILAIAAVAGGVAATRTAHLGAAAAKPAAVSNAVVAAQARRLARAEASLRRALAQRPPALPAARAAAAPRAALAAAPRTVYVRPAPIVHVVHRHGGEHEDHESGDSGDD